MKNNLPTSITSQTTLPVIAAPMFLVSGVDLVLAACKSGVIGSYPVLNERTSEGAEEWMKQITSGLNAAREADPHARIAPWSVNLITHRTNPRLQADLDLVVKYKCPLVITSLGSPSPAVEAVHSYGGLVVSDVITPAFAKKAAQTGIDGLVLVCAGAGGHAGMLSPFAFIQAVREFWDGMLIYSGAISNGRQVRTAQIMGADLVYMGTSFIATTESMADAEFKQMLIDSTLEDLVYTNAFSGAWANMLKPSIVNAGLDPDKLIPKDKIDLRSLQQEKSQEEKKAWKEIWSAGQGVGAIKDIPGVAGLIARLRSEYAATVAEELRGDAWTKVNYEG